MAESDVTSLTDLASALLSVSLSALQTTTAGAPDTYYIAPSYPAFDCCPAVIVHVQSLSEETTSPLSPPMATGRRSSYGRIALAQLVITAIRCAPKVEPDGSVLTSNINAVAAAVQEDAWALWNGVSCAIKNEVFLDKCADIHIDRSVSIREQGGCVGWEFQIRAELGGIPCLPESS